MGSTGDPNRTTGGLSTEDIAHPTESPSETTREPEGTAAGAPVYPGESTSEARKPATSDEEETSPLLPADDERGFRDRWQEIQGKFVDAPRDAVHAADGLVAEVMQTLADTFAQHKRELESQWGQGEQADTEVLRQTLRRYRSFFDRLLST